jgi:hypothetical protein
MKRILILSLVNVLGVLPVFPYHPIVEPDPAFMPALLDSTIHYSWDADSGVYFVHDRRVYTYDANGKLIKSEINPRGYWGGGSLAIYTYDANGDITEEIDYEWNEDSSDWVGYRRDVNTYDASGNLTEEIDYEWNEDSSDWVVSSRDVNTYDASGNLTEGIRYNWSYETNQWIITDKYDIYWSELTTSIHSTPQYEKCLIYPNPVNSFLTVETDNSENHILEIHSLNGKLIYSRRIEGSTFQIDLSSFQKGIYIISVRSRVQVWTEKIIKF